MKKPALLNRLPYRLVYALALGLLLLFANQTLSAKQNTLGTVKPLDEDSQLGLVAEPAEFWPDATTGNGHTKFSGRLYYRLRSPHLVTWKIFILDAEGSEVNSFAGSLLAGRRQEIAFSQAWDGTDPKGIKLAPGLYQAIAVVRLASTSFLNSDATFEDVPSLAREYTEGRFAAHVRIRYGTAIKHPPRDTVRPQVAPNEPGFPYNFYYGTLHTQTSFTDGGHPNDASCASSTVHAAGDFDPAMAYNYARNTAHLDFLGISDHNHLFNDACSGCAGAQVIQRYHDGLNAAATANADGSFVAIYGMEWGYIASADFPKEGHVNLYQIPKLFGWESGFYEVFTDPAGANYPAMYTAAKNNPSVWGAIGGFNHPATTNGGDFNGFGYTTDGDDVICTTAVISGPASGFSTTQADTGNRYAGPNTSMYPSWATYDTYNRILGAGFHVAPVADADVHCSNYGTSVHDRTVILATSLTKASILDALKNRRVFATSDANAQLVFTMVDLSNNTTHYMGEGSIRTQGPVQVSGQVKLHVSVFDPDAGETVSSIKIYQPVPNNTAGESSLIASSTASSFDFTFSPSSGGHAYYVYVTMNTGAEMWSAPIWINAAGAPDFSLSATPSSQTVAPGASTSYTVTVTPSGGFTGTVTFGVSGLPAGAAANFNPTSVAGSGSSTMSVTTSGTTPTGTYTLTITGTGGVLQHSTTVTLVVLNPDFSISASPSSKTIRRGNSGSYTVTVTPSAGFNGTVTFSVTGLPSGATASFNPTSVVGSGSSTMTVTVGSATAKGTYALTITGASSTLQHSASVSLTVR